MQEREGGSSYDGKKGVLRGVGVHLECTELLSQIPLLLVRPSAPGSVISLVLDISRQQSSTMFSKPLESRDHTRTKEQSVPTNGESAGRTDLASEFQRSGYDGRLVHGQLPPLARVLVVH